MPNNSTKYSMRFSLQECTFSALTSVGRDIRCIEKLLYFLFIHYFFVLFHPPTPKANIGTVIEAAVRRDADPGVNNQSILIQRPASDHTSSPMLHEVICPSHPQKSMPGVSKITQHIRHEKLRA